MSTILMAATTPTVAPAYDPVYHLAFGSGVEVAVESGPLLVTLRNADGSIDAPVPAGIPHSDALEFTVGYRSGPRGATTDVAIHYGLFNDGSNGSAVRLSWRRLADAVLDVWADGPVVDLPVPVWHDLKLLGWPGAVLQPVTLPMAGDDDVRSMTLSVNGADGCETWTMIPSDQARAFVALGDVLAAITQAHRRRCDVL